MARPKMFGFSQNPMSLVLSALTNRSQNDPVSCICAAVSVSALPVSEPCRSNSARVPRNSRARDSALLVAVVYAVYPMRSPANRMLPALALAMLPMFVASVFVACTGDAAAEAMFSSPSTTRCAPSGVNTFRSATNAPTARYTSVGICAMNPITSRGRRRRDRSSAGRSPRRG